MRQTLTRRRFLTLSGAALAGATTARLPAWGAAAQGQGGIWRAATSLIAPRMAHTATLLDDRSVLVVGGRGAGRNPALADVERYDPLADTWTRTRDLADRRAHHTATLLADGRVLVVGGAVEHGGTLRDRATAELYDPLRDRWTTAASLAVPRAFHTATRLRDGRVLVAGGNGLTAEVYDPAANRWSPAGRLATFRTAHTATLLPSGRVLVTGGAIRDGAITDCEVYIPDENRWVSIAPLRKGRFGHAATLLPDGRVLVTGGNQFTSAGGGPLETETLRGATGWSLAAPLAFMRGDHDALLLRDGRVFVVGGREGLAATVATTEVYDPATNRAGTGPTLAMGRVTHTTTLLDDGTVLVVGGRDENGDTLGTVERCEFAP